MDTTSYQPFGATWTGGDRSRLGYIGKEIDGESALGDYGARKYDPELGRFMSVDPLWEEFRQHNAYHYSYNNPLVFEDGSGKASKNKALDHAPQLPTEYGGPMGGSLGLGARLVRVPLKTAPIAGAEISPLGSNQLYNSARPGSRGGAQHRAEVERVTQEMQQKFQQDKSIVVKQEVTVKTPDGSKGQRRFDVAATRKNHDGTQTILEGHQVMRRTVRVDMPKREDEATRDFVSAIPDIKVRESRYDDAKPTTKFLDMEKFKKD